MRQIVQALAVILLCTSFCSACSSSSKQASAYVKPYRLENVQSNNLKKIFEKDLQVFEIRPDKKYTKAHVSVDLLENGVMKTRTSMQVQLSGDELNYLAVRSFGKGRFSVNFNGQSQSVPLSDYMNWEKEVKQSTLAQQEPLDATVYLMTFTDKGSLVIDPQKLASNAGDYVDAHIVAFKLAFS